MVNTKQRHGTRCGRLSNDRCPNQDTENKYIFSRSTKSEGQPKEKEPNIQKDTKKYKNAACLEKSKLCSVVSYVVSWHKKKQNHHSW